MQPPSSSLSDAAQYNDICREAAATDQAFAVFRRHPAYTAIVETLWDAGVEYIRDAITKQPDYIHKLDEFRKNETFGGPHVMQFSDIGGFAPTTLRYIKVAADLQTLFGCLDGANIAEIGVGYGGQCRILSCLHKFGSYTLYDLPDASRLATRYLSQFPVDNVRVADLNAEEPRGYDLVISNYAFSEIRRDLQDIYLDRVISRAKHGYMLYNQAAFSQHYGDYSYSADELAIKYRHFQIDRGEPQLVKFDVMCNNVLIHW